MSRTFAGCLAAILLFALPARAEGWRDTVTAFADANLKHPAWGASHSRRDYALAKSLAAADGVALDDDVLFAAAYLHDMAAFAPWTDGGIDHSDSAAVKFQTVLAGTDFPAAKLPAVADAIRTHMYYREPVSAEARYLHDADALDWLGAIGVARIFGRVDPKGGRPTGPDAVKMIEANRTAVPPRIVTPAGKAMVAQRLAEETAFLDALKRESGDLADL